MNEHVHNDRCEPATDDMAGLCALTREEATAVFVNAVHRRGWEPEAFIAAYESGALDWDPDYAHEVMLIPMYRP